MTDTETPTEPTALRDRYAAAIYEHNNPGMRWSDAHPDDLLAYGGDADAALGVRDRELEHLRQRLVLADHIHQENAATIERVRQLAERWENALAPDLAYARTLRAALNGPPKQPTECPPGVHSMFDPCPGDCSKPLNEPPTA